MKRHLVAFSRVPVGSLFSKNGNRCRKQSTRTARILDVPCPPVFYYAKRELVEVSDDVRDAIVAAEAREAM